MPLADATQTEPHAKGRPADKSQRPPRGGAGRRAGTAAPRLPRFERQLGTAIRQHRPRHRHPAHRAGPEARPRLQGRRPRPSPRRRRAAPLCRGVLARHRLRREDHICHPRPCRPRLGDTARPRRRRRPDGARGPGLQPGAARRDRRPRRALGHRHGGVRARRLHRRRRPRRHRPRPADPRAHRFPGSLARAPRHRCAHGQGVHGEDGSQGLRRAAAAARCCGSALSAASF